MSKKRADQISGAVFLIGLGLLFLPGVGFWPGILILIGVSMLFGYLFKPPILEGLFGGGAADDEDDEKLKRDDEAIYVDGEPVDPGAI